MLLFLNAIQTFANMIVTDVSTAEGVAFTQKLNGLLFWYSIFW